MYNLGNGKVSIYNLCVSLEDIPHTQKIMFGQQSILLPSCILVHFQAAAARAWSTVISSAVALIDKNLLRLWNFICSDLNYGAEFYAAQQKYSIDISSQWRQRQINTTIIFLLSEIEFEYKTMFRVKSCNKRHHLNDSYALNRWHPYIIVWS